MSIQGQKAGTSPREAESSTSASKDTAGKLDLAIVPIQAVEEIAKVLTYGAQKYGRNNYKKGHLNTDLISAALRHILAWNEGQDLDPESGNSHLSHALANLTMILVQVELGTMKEGRDLV